MGRVKVISPGGLELEVEEEAYSASYKQKGFKKLRKAKGSDSVEAATTTEITDGAQGDDQTGEPAVAT